MQPGKALNSASGSVWEVEGRAALAAQGKWILPSLPVLTSGPSLLLFSRTPQEKEGTCKQGSTIADFSIILVPLDFLSSFFTMLCFSTPTSSFYLYGQCTCYTQHYRRHKENLPAACAPCHRCNIHCSWPYGITTKYLHFHSCWQLSFSCWNWSASWALGRIKW